MKDEKFFEILADIDDKYILEAHEEDLETHQAAPVKNTSAARRTGLPRWILPVGIGIAALALVSIGIWKAGIFGGKSSFIHKEAIGSIVEHNATMAVIQDVAGEIVEEGSSILINSQEQQVTIPAFPSDRSIVLKGDPITDEEADAFFEENRELLTNMIDSRGFPTDDLQFNKKGFHHISYEGREGESLTIYLSKRTYLIYNRDEFVAKITLFRVNESGEYKIHYAFGYFGDTNLESFLNAHQGEKLLFFYANPVEIVMAPDGSVMNPTGIVNQDYVAQYFEDIDHPYETLYNELAVYIP